MKLHRSNRENDWSKMLAVRWGLAWCSEDAELDQKVAPRQPLRRLYRRLSHDPEIPFIPPDFATLLFVGGILHALFYQQYFSLGDWLTFSATWFVVSTILGLCLDFVFLPILFLLDKILEGLCWFADELVWNWFI